MINLIPIEEKARLKKDFYLRVLTVFFLMLTFIVVILCMVLLPSYLILSEKINSSEVELEKQSRDNKFGINEDAFKITKDLNFKIKLLENAQKNRYLVSTNIIEKVISKKIPGIKINQISYVEKSTEGKKKISISGTASNREELLSFRSSFEKDPSFSSVELPISNFIKGKNIQFFMNLIVS